MTSGQKRVAVLVRLPIDVKKWIEKEAPRAFASQNSEIIRSIRVRMENERSGAAG